MQKSRYDGLAVYNKMDSDNKIRQCLVTRFLDRTPPNDHVVHVVKSNDNLIHIAFEYYGDISLWYIIAEKNNWISDPFDLPIGAEIKIPVLE